MWPHGEWSLGTKVNRPDGGEWHEDVFVGLGVDDVAMEQRASRGEAPLNLSDASNSHKRPKRGLKGITGYGQQMVKAAGFLLQERYPQHRKTLGTVTLPPMSAETRKEIAERWSDLTRELLQWLSRRLERAALPKAIVSVTEIQPGRLQESGQGCLHWHLLWLNHPGRKGNWAVDPCDVRAWLDGLLRRHIPSYTGGHVNVNVKPVKGVVAAYLAKYMSKGKQMIAEAVQDWGGDACPSTWWNMTKPMRSAVQDETHHGTDVGAILDSLLQYAWDTGDTAAYAFLRPVEMEHDGATYIMGWRGRFCEPESQWVRAVLKSA